MRGCSRHALGLLLLMWAGQTEAAPPWSPLSDSRRVCEWSRPWDGANLGSLLRADPPRTTPDPPHPARPPCTAEATMKKQDKGTEPGGQRREGGGVYARKGRSLHSREGRASALEWRGLQIGGRGVHSRMGRGLYSGKGLYTSEGAQSWRLGLGQNAKYLRRDKDRGWRRT